MLQEDTLCLFTGLGCSLRDGKKTLRIKSYRVKAEPSAWHAGAPQYGLSPPLLLICSLSSLADQKPCTIFPGTTPEFPVLLVLLTPCFAWNAPPSAASMAVAHASLFRWQVSPRRACFILIPRHRQPHSRLHEYVSTFINMHLFIKQSSLRTEAVPGTELSPGKQK